MGWRVEPPLPPLLCLTLVELVLEVVEEAELLVLRLIEVTVKTPLVP